MSVESTRLFGSGIHSSRFIPFSIQFTGIGGRVVVDVLDGVLRKFRCDPDRVYLTGFSFGGTAAPDCGRGRRGAIRGRHVELLALARARRSGVGAVIYADVDFRRRQRR